MVRTLALCLLVAAPLATPAAAASDPETAVRALETRAQLAPRDGGIQIELAQAYLTAHRPIDAERAYKRALVLDNEMMETQHGSSIWSHQVARAVLDKNIAPMLSTR